MLYIYNLNNYPFETYFEIFYTYMKILIGGNKN